MNTATPLEARGRSVIGGFAQQERFRCISKIDFLPYKTTYGVKPNMLGLLAEHTIKALSINESYNFEMMHGSGSLTDLDDRRPVPFLLERGDGLAAVPTSTSRS